MVKPRLGLARGVLFKANYQGVPKTPNRVRSAKSRNITPILTETRAARVEQNTRHKAEPSTLYEIYRCINNIKEIL